jgi:hypothetical protein
MVDMKGCAGREGMKAGHAGRIPAASQPACLKWPGATGSDVSAGVFLFLLSSLSCQASRFARKSLRVPDERENEERERER